MFNDIQRLAFHFVKNSRDSPTEVPPLEIPVPRCPAPCLRLAHLHQVQVRMGVRLVLVVFRMICGIKSTTLEAVCVHLLGDMDATKLPCLQFASLNFEFLT